MFKEKILENLDHKLLTKKKERVAHHPFFKKKVYFILKEE